MKSKTVNKYTKAYKAVLTKAHFSDIDKNLDAYAKRLSKMYSSEDFKRHNIYPTTNTTYIYAIIAMCLELKKLGLNDNQIIKAINKGFSRRRNFFKSLLRVIDKLPVCYRIAKKWNISDHKKRVRDGSLTYDYFNVTEGKIEYCVSRCAYVEMFEFYGIRRLCKIFCMTDTTSYNNLTKHIKFVRHSDLSTGKCCHDEVIKKKK